MSDMTFEMGSRGIPVGSYRAEFIGAEPYLENVEKYGEGVLLKWRVTDGQHASEETSRICSRKMSPKSALGKLAVALRGASIAAGESFSFASYYGTRGSVLVEQTESGGTRVSTFIRDAPPPVATPVAPPATQPTADSGQQVSQQPAQLTPEQLAQAAAILAQQQSETI